MKKIFVITLILLVFISCSSVYAHDNTTNDIVGADESTGAVNLVDRDITNTDETKDIVGVGDSQVKGNSSNVGTFGELSDLIGNVSEGGTLELDKDYQYMNGSTLGIEINKPIIIDGKGHTLDGNNQSRIFKISDTNVQLKNIIFINGLTREEGGAISMSGNNTVYNCTFVNCIANDPSNFYDEGGAIKIYGAAIIKNCNFIDCYCTVQGGGAIRGYGPHITCSDCEFINCHSKMSGGALSFDCEYDFNINNCTFNNCFSYQGGGAIAGFIESIKDCKFINCHAPDGGAIEGYMASTVNCIFMNCYASKGGAICYYKSGNIENCIFDNNTAKIGNSIYGGGDSYDYEVLIIVKNSYFSKDEGNIESNEYCDVILIKRNATFIGNLGTYYYGEEINELPIFLKDLENNSICNQSIRIIINQDSLNAITNEEGMIILNDKLQLQSSTWDINIIFDGNDNYSPTDLTTILKIIPSFSSLNIEDYNTTVGYETTLIANVISNNSEVNEGIVMFFDGETNIGDVNVTGGVATLTYTPTTAGKHTITAFYNSDNYQSSNATASLLVAKANTELNIDYSSSVYFTTTNNFAVNITSNNNAVSEGKVKFYVNDVLVSSSDVISGVVNFDYIADMAGVFTFAIVYNGTENYFASNVTGNFYVSPMPTSLNGETKFFDEEQNKTFTVELNDINNNGVSNQIIKIEAVKYSGESITITSWTDEMGIAIFDANNLSGGMWIVRGIYDGNDNYVGSTFTDRFIVVRMNTTTTIEEITNPQVNQSYRLKANIHDENGKLVKEGIVQFYLDGVYIGSIDLSKNNGHQNTLGNGALRAVNPIFDYVLGDEDVSDLYINYVPRETGEHSLTAVYEGTTIYKSSNSTTTFIVTNKDVTTIDAPSVTSDFNDGSYLFATLKDSAGNGIKDCAFSIELNGVVNNLTTDSNGKVNLSLDNIKPGSYVAIITFEGNDDYLETSISTNVTINKLETEIDINVANVEYGQSVDINVTLDSVASGDVVLELNKQNYTESLVNGKCVFTIPNLEIDNYVIKVIYGGDNYYKGTESVASFEVTKVKIQDIEIPEIVSIIGMLKISLPNDAVGTVTLIINGKEYVSDAVNGDVNINISDLSAGDYPYVITYSGDAKYSSFTVSGSLKVNKTNPENKTVDPEVVIPPLDNPSEDGSVAIKLPSDATGIITLTINNKDYYFAVVDGNANLIIPNLDNGNYPYVITYSGDAKYSSFINNGSLNVNRVVSTKIIASNLVTVYNSGEYLVITLKNQNGKAVSGVKVTVKFSNGKVLTPTTDKNGQVKVSTNGLVPVKVYAATITFSGNANYAKSSKVVKVGVKKATPKLIASGKAYKVKAAKKYYVTLKTNRNVVMKNTWITVKIGKITLNARTNAKGIATFNLAKLNKKANYKATITYKGNNYYIKVAKAVYIRIL